MRQRAVRCLITLLLATGGPLLADEEGIRPWPSWSFQAENDLFAFFDPSDEHYTNGLRLSLLKHPTLNPAYVVRFHDWFCGHIGHSCRTADDFTTFGVALGHNFYTPEEITISAPQPLDRPWAGYFYGAQLIKITDAAEQPRWQYSFELDLGVVGQGAGAGWLQPGWHEVIRDPDTPRGWRHQIKNEPAISGVYLKSRRWGSSRVDLVAHWGGAAGTVMTYGNAGGTIRAGRNITGFPATPIPTTVAPTAAENRPRSEYWFFVGVDSRYVLENIFLDGGFFRDGPGVERKEVVTDLQGGFSFRRDKLRLSAIFLQRSNEFRLPPGRTDGTHGVGSLILSYEPPIRQR